MKTICISSCFDCPFKGISSKLVNSETGAMEKVILCNKSSKPVFPEHGIPKECPLK